MRVGEVPVTVHTPLVLVLPFLLWAAVRFGTAGASLSLLVTALSAVQSAIAHAAYTDPAAAEASVLTLQAFLIMLAIPLLCLAALVEERYRARIDVGAAGWRSRPCWRACRRASCTSRPRHPWRLRGVA